MNKNRLMQVGMFILTIVIMSHFMGWAMAIAIVSMLVFHEWGHALAAKHFGASCSGIYMIPFVGGVANIVGKLSRFESAMMSAWGPLHGLIFSLISLGIFLATGNPIFLKISQFCSVINLFNLLPINPLDGGRILTSIAFSANKWIGKAVMISGIVIACGLAIWIHSPVFIALALLSIMDFSGEKLRGFSSYNMTKGQIMIVIGVVLGIISLLFVPFLFPFLI